MLEKAETTIPPKIRLPLIPRPVKHLRRKLGVTLSSMGLVYKEGTKRPIEFSDQKRSLGKEISDVVALEHVKHI
ncbi:MAG: hypothetical protein DRO05_03235 [Thermoproteota archaeon]|nr:MAG: hypothetical protein DRO05_03235 [Candidatus Korarchaeota archaeon]